MNEDFSFTVKIDSITVQANSIEELTAKLKEATEGKQIALIGAVVGVYEITPNASLLPPIDAKSITIKKQ